jgi:hypothetical protein
LVHTSACSIQNEAQLCNKSRAHLPLTARPLPEAFLLHALHFIRDVDRCDKYNADTAPPDVPEAAEAIALTRSFFTPDMVLQIFDVLLNRFLAFSTEEQEKWEEDPESFAITEIGTGWKYVLKVGLCATPHLVRYRQFAQHSQQCRALLYYAQSTAEHVYQTLITQHREIVAPKLLEYVAASAGNPRMREAVYNCVGVGASPGELDAFPCLTRRPAEKLFCPFLFVLSLLIFVVPFSFCQSPTSCTTTSTLIPGFPCSSKSI